MKSKALTIEQYLAELPADRLQAIQTVRRVILENLPPGYEEVMNWGMITYQVPLAVYTETYNKKPLMYAALSSQKNHMAVYLTGIYLDESRRRRFISDYLATGKRLDMAKSCVRFKKLEDLPLKLIGQAVAEYTVHDFIARIEAQKTGVARRI